MSEDLTTGWDRIIVAPLDSVDAVAVRAWDKTLLWISSAVPERNRKATEYYLDAALSIEPGEVAAAVVPLGTAVGLITYEPRGARRAVLRRRLRALGWRVVDRAPLLPSGAPMPGTAGPRTPHAGFATPVPNFCEPRARRCELVSSHLSNTLTSVNAQYQDQFADRVPRTAFPQVEVREEMPARGRLAAS